MDIATAITAEIGVGHHGNNGMGNNSNNRTGHY
jgi:hypothetical protein